MAFLVRVGFKVIHYVHKLVVKGIYLFLEVLDVHFFVLIAGLNELFDQFIKIVSYFLYLLLVKLFMFRYESFQILHALL